MDDHAADTGFTPEPVTSRRIVALLSDQGHALDALLEAREHDELGGDLVAVISDREQSAGALKAREAGIDVAIVPRGEYDTSTAYDGALIKVIERHEPDLVVVDDFRHVFSSIFTSRFNGRLLNVHPALLPDFTGHRTHQRVLEAGADLHGASVHFVTEPLNAGPLVIQAVARVSADDDIDTLSEKVVERAQLIYPIAIRWFLNGRLVLSPQGATLDGVLLPPTGLRLSHEDVQEELYGE